VGWLYLIALGHLVGAVAMTWLVKLPLFTDYHQSILAAFGFASAQQEVMALHTWWMSLFGATLQAFAIFLLALVYLANRYRNAVIWLLLASVILLWAPQDMVISLQRNVWSHVWVDLAAIIALVPPLLILWWLDRK
jgi:hypothetical protein